MGRARDWRQGRLVRAESAIYIDGSRLRLRRFATVSHVRGGAAAAGGQVSPQQGLGVCLDTRVLRRARLPGGGVTLPSSAESAAAVGIGSEGGGAL